MRPSEAGWESGPLLPENSAQIFLAPLKYFLVLPKITLILLPKSLKVRQFLPSSQNIQACSLCFSNVFGNASSSKSKWSSEFRFWLKEFYGMVILTCIKWGGGLGRSLADAKNELLESHILTKFASSQKLRACYPAP